MPTSWTPTSASAAATSRSPSASRASRARPAFPRFVYFHLTKNATERNLRTVETLIRGGVGTQVALSMQDFEPAVLRAIRRDNIPPAKALLLRERCHAQGLPTTNELLLGLPAQTAASFRRSLVAALTPFPRDSFYLYPTRLLVNAEMADPDYRRRFRLETRRVPVHFADPDVDAHVAEVEEIVVASAAMPVARWRAAFAFGFLLTALVNQRLLATTLHVLRWAVAADVAAFVDALLAGATPRLAAIRAELDRFADAILDEVATALPIRGFGPKRREPVDAVVARVLEDAEGFRREVGTVARRLFGPRHAAVLAEAAAWDAFLLPVGGETTRVFAWNWPAYAAAAGKTPAVAHGPVTVRRSLPPPCDGATALDRFLAAGYAKVPRVAFAVLPVAS